MPENPKVRLDEPDDPASDLPEGQISLREVAARLGELLGGEWTAVHRGTRSETVALCTRFTESSSGRWVLSGLLLLGDEIKGEDLRKVPVSVLENSWNFAKNLTAAGAPAVSFKSYREELAELPPLKRTPGMTPEQFSQLVAQHYRIWATNFPNPVAAIAEEWGVKPPTVHTWIREARLRGYLPPARGKAT